MLGVAFDTRDNDQIYTDLELPNLPSYYSYATYLVADIEKHSNLFILMGI